MAAADKVKKLSVTPPPPGVTFSVATHAPHAVMSGLIDYGVIFAGTPAHDALQVYVDGVALPEPMKLLSRNRYIQFLDTAQYVDGMHELAVAAVDARGGVIACQMNNYLFRNIDSFSYVSLLPTQSGNAFEAYLRINTLRTTLPAEHFHVIDFSYTENERERLDVSVEYLGSTMNGTPVATVTAARPGNQKLAGGLHRLTFTINDNQGNTCAFMANLIRV